MSRFSFIFPSHRAPARAAAPDLRGADNVVTFTPPRRRSVREAPRAGAAADVVAFPAPAAGPFNDGPPGPRAA